MLLVAALPGGALDDLAQDDVVGVRILLVWELTQTGGQMRYTKTALLIFGLGLVLGLAVVTAEVKSLERVASGVMALGIAALPIGLLADLRRGMTARPHRARRRARVPVRRAPAAMRRPRKSATMKR